MSIKVTKSTGTIEDFVPDKLRISLVKAGASAREAEEVINMILDEVEPLTSTKKIYRLAHKYLRHINHTAGLRYSLKRALFRLGPSGYPFEKYYSAIMGNYGFRTETGVLMQGQCVRHEVDVFAVNENEVHLVECKYHNRPENSVDVKVAMYVHSRFRDLEPAISKKHPAKKVKGWLVTNTRFTADALQYVSCYSFDVRSWNYPKQNSLEMLIEEKRLYPVTIVSGIKSGLISLLLQENIILLKDLMDVKTKEMRKMLSLPERKAQALRKQASELCGC